MEENFLYSELVVNQYYNFQICSEYQHNNNQKGCQFF